jgi:hypothetical protein
MAVVNCQCLRDVGLLIENRWNLINSILRDHWLAQPEQVEMSQVQYLRRTYTSSGCSLNGV